MSIVLDIIRWSAYITAGAVWLGVVLVVVSLAWASFKQKRQERRERESDRLASKKDLGVRLRILEDKCEDLSAWQDGFLARLKKLEETVKPQTPESKPCSSKPKNSSQSTKK